MVLPNNGPGILPDGPVAGLIAPWRAIIFLLGNRGLWLLALAPFFLNILLFGLALWLGIFAFQNWLHSWLPTGDAWWWSLLYYLLFVLVILAFLGLLVYLFVIVGRILAAPFLEILTRRTETIALGRSHNAPDFGFWEGILRVLFQEAKKMVLYLLIMAGLLVFHLVPVLGSVFYTILAFWVTCFFLCLEFMDFSLERRGLSLKAKLAYAWRLKLGGLFFGASVMAGFLVPLLNLAFLPVAAVGGTLYYLKNPVKSNGRI
ncbi:EI24 domain-containing protein [Dethiosulfatarculus sandiegensis]|nr:EI24 domain-containing protein [Dethiosulfatarculus sandiegensis]